LSKKEIIWRTIFVYLIGLWRYNDIIAIIDFELEITKDIKEMYTKLKFKRDEKSSYDTGLHQGQKKGG